MPAFFSALEHTISHHLHSANFTHRMEVFGLRLAIEVLLSVITIHYTLHLIFEIKDLQHPACMLYPSDM